MAGVVAYFRKNIEQTFVLAVLVSVILLNWFVPYKIAFLNFYYLPIMLLGYFMGKETSILGSLLCIFVVTIFALISPDSFLVGKGFLDVAMSLVTWASFILLSGILVGTLQGRLADENRRTHELNQELSESYGKLSEVNESLLSSNKALEDKTTELEFAKHTIENLKEKVEDTLYSTMDASVAKLLIQNRLRNEKKNISLLFSDLVGFTVVAEENQPETVINELNKYIALMESTILNYWGHIDKYQGDGIMCEFGAPHDYDHHGLQAVIAGMKMQERLAEADLRWPWQMRIGIGSGSCITGMIGLRRKSYTAIGDVVNVASRLEQICPPGGIFIDEETFQRVQDFIEVRKVKSFGKERKRDHDLFDKIVEREKNLQAEPDNLDLLMEVGRMYFELREVSKAVQYFERAHSIDPENAEIKLLYAEANLKRDQYEKIEIKGKKDRISVFEVVGIKDSMMDRRRIPQPFYDRYRHVEDLIEIPNDVILPAEALDGTVGHSKIVAILSYAIGDVLGLTEQDKRNLLIAGYLEDIGKQIIPHVILNRRGSLMDTEVVEVQKHPIESVKILKSMGYVTPDILEIVEHHHERFNGEGYPHQKVGEDIPLGARITAVADSYNALISWRPYREGWERRSALAEIEKDTQEGKFDRRCVDVLTDLMAD